MRKQKLLTKALAASMAVFMSVAQLPVSTFAANTASSKYVLMNIPYADFYKAEVKNEVPVDAFTSATKNKTRTASLVAGSYHVNSDGSDITGITYPVKVSDSDLAALTTAHTDAKVVTDSDSVSITVTNRGQTKTDTFTGADSLFENPSYSYYILKDTPAYYKELTVNKGNVSFGKSVGAAATIINSSDAVLTTVSSYGDYQLNIPEISDYVTPGTDKVYAVIISTKEGDSYGLRHMENIWRVNELSFATGFTEAVHNCPTSSAHYKKIMGQTINKITYYTDKGVFTVNTNKYVPVKTAADSYQLTLGDPSFCLLEEAKSITSSDENVIKVSSDGTITATGVGTATVTTVVTEQKGHGPNSSATEVTNTYNFTVSKKAVTPSTPDTTTASRPNTTTAARPSTKPATTAKKTNTKPAKKVKLAKQTVKVKVNGKKKIKVSWKKDKKASGYEITYSTKKSFKGKKTIVVKSNKTTSKVVKKLTSKKKYFMKVRSYKQVGKTKTYGAYSKVKTVKVK